MAHIIDPGILTLTPCRVEVVTEGLCDGRSVFWRTSRYPDEQANCQVAIGVDAKRFFEVFCHTLFPDSPVEIQHMLNHEFRGKE
jgi:purine nucleosidase